MTVSKQECLSEETVVASGILSIKERSCKRKRDACSSEEEEDDNREEISSGGTNAIRETTSIVWKQGQKSNTECKEAARHDKEAEDNPLRGRTQWRTCSFSRH